MNGPSTLETPLPNYMFAKQSFQQGIGALEEHGSTANLFADDRRRQIGTRV